MDDKIKLNPGTLSEERDWLEHKAIHEWWSATMILQDDKKNLYTVEFTILTVNLILAKPRVLMLAVTDFKNDRYLYSRGSAVLGKDMAVGIDHVIMNNGFCGRAADGMVFRGESDDFAFNLTSIYTKPAAWHGDDGIVSMGTGNEKDYTFYYSRTNMPTEGTLVIDGNAVTVRGLGWFDKQGGPFSIFDRQTHWERFTIRFYDQEEIMLFHYPERRGEGSYIRSDGRSKRIRSFDVKPSTFTETDGKIFSTSWEILIPGIKEEFYKVRPFMKKQFNDIYYETLCRVTDKNGREAGLCFAELLPGVYNDDMKMSDLTGASTAE